MLVVSDTAVLKSPIAVADYVSTPEDSSLVIKVIANDSTYGLPVKVSIVTPPQRGSTVVNPGTNTVLYQPLNGLCGLDSFRYAISNTLGTDTTTVFVNVFCDELVIYSGFSPNGDGVNDNFVIQGLDKYPNNHLIIFNRWGNQVYGSSHYKNDWGGTFDGKELPDGTYFYILELGQGIGNATLSGRKLSGYIQLLR